MKPAVPVLLALLFAGCNSTTPAPQPAATKAAAPAPVPDHTSLLLSPGQVSKRVVPDHILDMKAAPGGSLGEYKLKGNQYEMFVIQMDSSQKAAFLMVDMRNEMQNPEYIANMGGYFGTYQNRPLYVFAKLHFVAGIWGLPRAKADPLARQLAVPLF